MLPVPCMFSQVILALFWELLRDVHQRNVLSVHTCNLIPSCANRLLQALRQDLRQSEWNRAVEDFPEVIRWQCPAHLSILRLVQPIVRELPRGPRADWLGSEAAVFCCLGLGPSARLFRNSLIFFLTSHLRTRYLFKDSNNQK